MCTALSMKSGDHYFGRNLDLEYSMGEAVIVMPRRFPLSFKRMPALGTHLAMIGVGVVADDYPLYYDAVNEAGLCIAALNFPGNAHYAPPGETQDSIAPYELIPWLLAQCKSAAHARALLERISIAALPFSQSLPLSPLHYLISDANESITVEPMCGSLHIHDNPCGVLTNNPPFPAQMDHLSRYMVLSNREPENTLAPAIALTPNSRGTGAIGLPGDLSSASRFVRAVFMKAHSLCKDTPEESVTQFFHILGSVTHVRGSVMVHDRPEITVYSSCCNASRGVYHYTTYENRQITAIDMHRENLDAKTLFSYQLILRQQIFHQNGS